MIRGTYHLTMAGFEADEVRTLILRRRLQVLVHSCLYYKLDNSIISDQQWDEWARELVKLQRAYPRIAERLDYHQAFKDFDASTGFDLPIHNPEIIMKAKQLLEIHKKMGGDNIGKRIRIDLSGVRGQDKEPGSLGVHKGRITIRQGRVLLFTGKYVW